MVDRSLSAKLSWANPVVKARRVEAIATANKRRKKPVQDWHTIFYASIKKVKACWLWTGSIDKNGYGLTTYRGKLTKAHRAAYTEFKGSPGELFVLHTCDTPACVRPKHLFLGTQKDNVQDMLSKGRGYVQTEAHRLFQKTKVGERNSHAKLTEEDVLTIRARYAAGEKMIRMEEEYKVSYACIQFICHKRSWKHLK